jgi:hypothetical protein
MKDLSQKNDVDGYCQEFNLSAIPIDGPLNKYLGFANLIKTQAACEKLRSVAAGASTPVPVLVCYQEKSVFACG